MKQTICLQCGRVFFGIISFLAHTCEPIPQKETAMGLMFGYESPDRTALAEIAELERMYQL